MNDNWKHRSSGMRCQTCMWFVAKSPPQGVDEEAPAHKIGRCRRHAPNQVAIGWPAVFSDDWCGDHKIDEEKI